LKNRFIITALMLLAQVFFLGPVAILSANAASDGCIRQITKIISFDLPSYISAEEPLLKVDLNWNLDTPITIAIANDRWLLRFLLDEATAKFTPERRKRCLNQSVQIADALDEFFDQRLVFLLNTGELDRFNKEILILREAPPKSSWRKETYRHFKKLEIPYLQAIREKLYKDLTNTKWSKYTNYYAEITTWDHDWSALMGREAPAAVNLLEKQIALRPFEFSPDELEIFLFHELAHLDNGRANHLSPVGAEVFAWTQTIDYIEYLQASGRIIPDYFVKIVSATSSLGIREWVRAVLFTLEQRSS